MVYINLEKRKSGPVDSCTSTIEYDLAASSAPYLESVNQLWSKLIFFLLLRRSLGLHRHLYCAFLLAECNLGQRSPFPAKMPQRSRRMNFDLSLKFEIIYQNVVWVLYVPYGEKTSL